jgi:hypothetical protein
MSAAAIPVPDIHYGLPTRFGRGWAGALAHLQRSRVRPGGQMMTECFGRLTDRDEMVAKGLSVSFACSIERGEDGW